MPTFKLRERKRRGQATSFCGYDLKVVHIISTSIESGHIVAGELGNVVSG